MFRSLVTDLLSSHDHNLAHPPTFIAPLYAAVSHWPEACSPSWGGLTPDAATDTVALLGSVSPDVAFSAAGQDPFGLAMHTALRLLFASILGNKAAAETPSTLNVPSVPRRLQSSLSLSGSSGAQREWLVCIALARKAMLLINPSHSGLEHKEPTTTTTSCQEGLESGYAMPLTPKLANLFNGSCRGLLSTIRWSLPFAVSTSDRSRDVIGHDPVWQREASAASAHHLACAMLCLLGSWTSISGVYTQVCWQLWSCH